jgi:hypothetical protein
LKIEGFIAQDEICRCHREHVESALGLDKLKFGNRSQRLSEFECMPSFNIRHDTPQPTST